MVVLLKFLSQCDKFVDKGKTYLDTFGKIIKTEIEKEKKKFHTTKEKQPKLDRTYSKDNTEIHDGINVEDIERLSDVDQRIISKQNGNQQQQQPSTTNPELASDIVLCYVYEEQHTICTDLRKNPEKTILNRDEITHNQKTSANTENPVKRKQSNRDPKCRARTTSQISSEESLKRKKMVITRSIRTNNYTVSTTFSRHDRRVFESNKAMLFNNCDLDVPGRTLSGYRHCSWFKAELEVCQPLNGNIFESSFKSLRCNVELWLRTVGNLLREAYDIVKAYFTSVDDEIVFEKLNHTIRDHVAVVFEGLIRYYAPLSSSELKTIVDYVKNGTSSNDPKFRMNLVTSRVFDDAMRDCRVHIFQLTYSYVYPRNCRMLIGIPVYKDGYINGKDIKQNR